MTRRMVLRRKILDAWSACLGDYNDRRITSERSLQAAFWFRLIEAMDIKRDTPRRIFIEPHLRIDSTDYYPDIVICNSRNVIGVVELKYQPRKLPNFEKDLNTITALEQKKGSNLSMRNRRYLGPALQQANYHFSKDVVFAWAGIHRESSKSRLDLKTAASRVIDNFMQLHIETFADNDAKFLADSD